jgi:phosphate transport system permease protein
MPIFNRQKIRVIKDNIARNAMFTITILSLLVALLIGIGLYLKASPILHEKSLWSLLTTTNWKPFKGEFGFYPFIMGTLWVTGIAIIIAFPLSLLTSIYLSEYAIPQVRKAVEPVLDILAGIPPVVYGVWGALAVVPFISNHIAPHFIEYSTGYSVLAGGIVLAVMIIPLLISLFSEIFRAIPKELRDASLSLGATDWQTTKFVILRKSVPGIVASTVLAISRAFGETIAVLMVCGNIPIAPKSIFDSGYPLPALIANNYGEMMSMPNYESALMLAALILFVIILLFNTISRVVLIRIERRFSI